MKPYDPLEHNADYERGFVDGMQEQMKSSVDKAVNTMSKREWKSLTDEEISSLWKDKIYVDDFARAIEAKLKEKNHG